MEQFPELMRNVWREACRHIEIAESASRIADLLGQGMPLGRLIVRRIDRDLAHLETVAAVPRFDEREREEPTARWAKDDIQRLARWCGRGEIQHMPAGGGKRQFLSAVLPSPLMNEALIGPLVSEHGTLGLLLVEAESGCPLTAAHERMFQALLEPFAVALENDHRLRELRSLREAAESEKRSLLARLGREDLGEVIVGESGGLRAVMQRVELVARSDVPALILGETGSGKEVIARAIHNRSPLAQGPFIRVNCGAIPPELIDSELFGHETGSFTGATSTRRGWFERADEGTLFLDEIGELPPAAQVRLLRVLQDGLFERVGGEELRKVEVRIVAATHRDLAAMVQTGTFREDLWYRIAVFPIMLPPLRDRREDIPALAGHFAQRAATRFGLKPRIPTAQDIALLSAYGWPGNIREFGSVMDRAAILGDGESLDIAASLGGSAAATAIIPPSQTPSRSADRNSPATIIPLDDAMRRHIESALFATGGRVEGPRGAATLLRINPHTLRARMRKLGIDWAGIREEVPE